MSTIFDEIKREIKRQPQSRTSSEREKRSVVVPASTRRYYDEKKGGGKKLTADDGLTVYLPELGVFFH